MTERDEKVAAFFRELQAQEDPAPRMLIKGDVTFVGNVPNCFVFTQQEDRWVLSFHFDTHPSACARTLLLATKHFGDALVLDSSFLTDTQGQLVFETSPAFQMLYLDYAENVAKKLRDRVQASGVGKA